MNQQGEQPLAQQHHEGSCLCGQIRYSVTGEISEPTLCHCHMCQKQHGAPFGVYSDVNTADLHWISGQDQLAHYQSSETVSRSFCRNCGSTLQFLRNGRSTFGLAIGSLDTPLNSKPRLQICTSSCASWWTLQDMPTSYTEYYESPIED